MDPLHQWIRSLLYSLLFQSSRQVLEDPDFPENPWDPVGLETRLHLEHHSPHGIPERQQDLEIQNLLRLPEAPEIRAIHLVQLVRKDPVDLLRQQCQGFLFVR